MEIRDFYQQMGVDYGDILRRLSSERLILKYLGKMLREPSYGQLVHAYLANDPETAFRAAHTIKGMCLNLDLHPLLESSSRLTERLRGKAPLDPGCDEYRKLNEDYQKVMGAIRSLLGTEEQG